MLLKLRMPEAQVPNTGRGAFKNGDIRGLLSESLFTRMLCVERKRAERSMRPFLLMILEAPSALQSFKNERTLLKIATALCNASRETDFCGWYEERNFAIGLVFPELGQSEPEPVIDLLRKRILKALFHSLDYNIFEGIRVSFYVFPDGWATHRRGEASLIEPNGTPRIPRRNTKGEIVELGAPASVSVR